MKTGCQFTTRTYHLFDGDGALVGAITDSLTEPVFGVGAPTLFLSRSELGHRAPVEPRPHDLRRPLTSHLYRAASLLASRGWGVKGHRASRTGGSKPGVGMMRQVETHKPLRRHTSPRGTAPFRGA